MTVTKIVGGDNMNNATIVASCNCCGKSRVRALWDTSETAFRDENRKLGWTGPMIESSDIDLCPSCSDLLHAGSQTLDVIPRMEPVKITQWFKPGDHPEVEFSFGNAFIEMILADGSRNHKYLVPGNYIVETKKIRLVMTPEEVAENFVLPSKVNVFK